ncbi:hypothetical protein AMECASPLE_032592 [Ameca splendens]|uniref:Uncharacterized protein n=1 Tax=Ameca splendens TaxID=208324 RepID=A0ABV0YTK5_9TELE
MDPAMIGRRPATDGEYALPHCWVSGSVFASMHTVSSMPWRTTPISSIPILLSPYTKQLLGLSLLHSCWGGT